MADIREYSALSLAYLGDAVFELMVREHIMKEGNRPVNKLNSLAKKYVKATEQSKMYDYLIDFLSEEESRIMKSGRNAKSFSAAKNASMIEYRKATGLESLFGYLKLTENEDRLKEIFLLCLDVINTEG